ncbi:hypothetical protein DFP78_103252 [Photobacterium lutimaris]|nr:hypothetical protein DFP78_103252 [Photobacterium lutimaris]
MASMPIYRFIYQEETVYTEYKFFYCDYLCFCGAIY